MGGQISKERFQKHLRIGIRFDGAGFVLLNGNPLPALVKDCVAELVLAPECVQDANLRASLTGQKSILLLKEGSLVLCGVSRTMIDDIFAEGLNPSGPVPIHSAYNFVEVKLDMQVPRVHVLHRFENRASPVPEVFNVAHIQEGHMFIKMVNSAQTCQTMRFIFVQESVFGESALVTIPKRMLAHR
jgi:hypothetical protein